MDDLLTPNSNFQAIGLDKFYKFTNLKLKTLPALLRLGFKEKEIFKGASAIEPFQQYYRIIYTNGKRSVAFFMYDESGGHYIVSVTEKVEFNEGDMFDLEHYYKTHGNSENIATKGFRISNYTGSLEKRVGESLDSINHLFEGKIEAILSGDEWIEIPPPGFFDYK